MSADFLSTREATLSALDLQKKRYYDLKAHLNSFAPINDLPPEVLSHIFYNLIQGHMSTLLENAEGPTSYQDAYQYHILVPYVCRHWRSILRSHPYVWSTVFIIPDSQSLAAVEMVISLSGQVPLKVVVGDGPIYLESFPALAAVLNQLYRIKDLRFTARQPPILSKKNADSIASYSAHSAPQLIRLVLFYGPSHWPAVASRQFGHQDGAFLFPHLQDLQCSGFSFKAHTFMLVSPLTCLVLRDWLTATTSHMVLKALSRVPLLQHLELAGDLDEPKDEDMDDEMEVHLPYLHDLILQVTSSRFWVQVLQCLSLPATTRVSYSSTFKTRRAPDAYASEILPVFQQHLQKIDYSGSHAGLSWPFLTMASSHHPHSPYSRSSLTLWTEDALEVPFRGKDGKDKNSDDEPTAFFSLAVHESGAEATSAAFSGPTAGVRVLCINPSPDKVDEWYDRYGHLEHVEALAVVGGFSVHKVLAIPVQREPQIISKALVKKVEEGREENSDPDIAATSAWTKEYPILFPKLRILLVGIMADHSFWKNLYESLRSRSLNEKRLEKLIVFVREGWHIGRPSEKIVSQLKEVVDVVVQYETVEDMFAKARPRQLFHIMHEY